MSLTRRGFLAFLVSAPIAKFLPWRKPSALVAPAAPVIFTGSTLTFEEIVTATMLKHRDTLAANIAANNKLLLRWKKGEGINQ